MPLTRLPFVAIFAVLAYPALAGAQAPTQIPDIDPPPVLVGIGQQKPTSERNVRIDATVTLKGGPKPIIKVLSMVARDGGQASGRANVEMPYATGSSGGPQFNYRSIGVNVDATPTILASGKISVRLRLSFNTLYRAESTTDGGRPSFGISSHEAQSLVFDSGKPVTVIQSSDVETGREYTVEVKATILP
jgi:hypothetical protein